MRHYSLGVNCLLFLLLTVQTIRLWRAQRQRRKDNEYIENLRTLLDDMLEKGYK
ncbi:hypothetical protein LCGC14_2131660 [marine sediment metagenome]|uniref:Uncharacterized protein n=1 Tax=marine sediment metagenome TaxID=412755 RepID=A0A0F9GEC8_9ZZZZ